MSEPSLIQMFERVLGELTEMKSRLAQIEKTVSLNVTKEAYTTEELSERLGFAVFTIRQWANKGCIQAKKVRGKGRKGEWRFSPEELARITADGPMPERTFDNHLDPNSRSTTRA